MYLVAYYCRTTGERAGWLAAKATRGNLRTFKREKARKLVHGDAFKIAGRCNAASTTFRAEIETV
jgi:hypothetical protein